VRVGVTSSPAFRNIVSIQITACKSCGTEFEYGHKPGYCSQECYHRHRGENTIRQIQSDHTVCSSCFATLKTVDTPPSEFLQRISVENGEHTREALVGFEYHTPNLRKDHGFSYCKCGNIDTYAEITELQEIDLADVVVNLWSLLVDYYHADQFGDNRPDKDTLFETLQEHGTEWELAIGRCVYE